MSSTRYQLGRLGRVYIKAETTYGTAPGFAGTDAVRHLDVKLTKKNNRADAPDRYTHPDLVQTRARRAEYTWSVGGILFPSGTINTVPDNDECLEHGFGAKTNVILSTTLSGTPTTTTGTVASATGLAVGGAVLISVASLGAKFVRVLTSVSGTNLTWAPALPSAPASGDAVKSALVYKLANDLAKSLNIGQYLQDLSFQGYGAVVDQLKLSFDANDEVRWEASGPMQKRVRPAVTADPGTFTTVGTQPPSGLTGGFTIDGSPEDYVKAEFTINNAMALDNMAGGTSLARGFYRPGKRTIAVAIDSQLSDDVTMLTAGEGATDTPVLVQSGDTEGNIIAVYCPVVEFDAPDSADSDGVLDAKYQGKAKATAAGNDAIYLVLA